ncbi:bestrophin family ion channel [soil metagenome]
MLLEKTIPAKYIFNKVKREVLYVFLLSIAVLLLTEMFQDWLPDMPLTIPAFIGTAISILLSFKLNQSYDRWWEARKVWGGIVNDSRTFVLQLQSLVAANNDDTIKKLGYRQIAWGYSLGQALRGTDPLANLEGLLPANEIEAISKHANKPLAIMQLQGDDIKQLKETKQLDVFSHIQLDDTMVRLVASAGMAERIKGTVFPVTYRLFLHFIIYLFVVTLSIALQGVQGVFEIPLLLVISTSFFLLEKSATHMQDPFSNKPTDTAVTAIARNIEINLKQLLKDDNVPAPKTTDDFYLM